MPPTQATFDSASQFAAVSVEIPLVGQNTVSASDEPLDGSADCLGLWPEHLKVTIEAKVLVCAKLGLIENLDENTLVHCVTERTVNLFSKQPIRQSLKRRAKFRLRKCATQTSLQQLNPPVDQLIRPLDPHDPVAVHV